jgi:hypothetical protein
MSEILDTITEEEEAKFQSLQTQINKFKIEVGHIELQKMQLLVQTNMLEKEYQTYFMSILKAHGVQDSEDKEYQIQNKKIMLRSR